MVIVQALDNYVFEYFLGAPWHRFVDSSGHNALARGLRFGTDLIDVIDAHVTCMRVRGVVRDAVIEGNSSPNEVRDLVLIFISALTHSAAFVFR